MKTSRRWWSAIGLGLLGAGALAYILKRRGTPPAVTGSRDLARKFGDDERKRDVVEEASWESFPASDSPAY